MAYIDRNSIDAPNIEIGKLYKVVKRVFDLSPGDVIMPFDWSLGDYLFIGTNQIEYFIHYLYTTKNGEAVRHFGAITEENWNKYFQLLD